MCHVQYPFIVIKMPTFNIPPPLAGPGLGIAGQMCCVFTICIALEVLGKYLEFVLQAKIAVQCSHNLLWENLHRILFFRRMMYFSDEVI